MIFTAGFAYSILLILTINTKHSSQCKSQIKLKMDGGFYLLVVIGLVSLGVVNSVHGQGTRVGFYSSTCPRAESIVRSTVQSHLNSDLTLAAGLLRMHFHDCFVQGCDGSVLISGNNTEKSAPPNLALRGFEVIDDAKTQLEAACPNVVSCADILALAARDSVVLSGGVSWQVPTGRRDGLVSRESDVELPGPDDSVDLQKQKFAALGLDTKDLVTLVGGHTIGTTSCGLLSSRLYNFNGRNGPDPTIDPSFLPQLQALCPQNGGAPSKRVPLDNGSQTKFDTSYFTNVKKGRGILQSDQALWTDPSTKALVQRYSLGLTFNVDFGNSMVKMSNIGVKTGSEGEIRKRCSAFN
ncbi:cationic peroxidase 2-like [Arachis stenosperma]|nr:cationic peroxidase 2-like [Arachis stenosperma]